jgi:ribosomal protein S18 acetylase RimI-like enzyme
MNDFKIYDILGKFFFELVDVKKDFRDEAKVALINQNTLLKSEKIFFIAQDDKVLGFSGIVKKKFLPQFFIVVSKSYQGMGLGTSLTDAAIKFSLSSYGFIYLSTYQDGKYDNAIKIYEKLGFKTLDIDSNKITMCITHGYLGAIKRFFLKIFLKINKLVN